MSQAFYGEVQLFAFNFAPQGWALCSGQLMMVSQNSALFSVLGTSFGGNGSTTFGLPNLGGQAACATGQGPGLDDYPMGSTFGSETVALQIGQIPTHTHTANIYVQPSVPNRFGSPSAGRALIEPASFSPFTTTNATNGAFPSQTLAPNLNAGFPHPNQQPYLALNFSICLAGIYPPRQ
jgi:microcystin-dependent protein